MNGFRMLGFRAPNDNFFAGGIEVGEINVGKLVVGLALVHLFLDAATPFQRVLDIFFEFLRGWITNGMQQF